MHLAIEMFAAVNLCMDTVSILAAHRLCTPAKIQPMRVSLGALVGMAYAFVSATITMPTVLDVTAFVFTAYIMAAIAIPTETVRERLRGCILLTLCCMLTGGVCTALARFFGTGVMTLLCGGAALGVFVHQVRRSTQRTGEAAVVTCVYHGRQARMRALIDTGNRLVDPLTGLPVIAAPREALGELIPDSVRADDLQTLPHGFRLLRAQTAAGPCLLMCFHPQQLMIEYEGRCAGVQALIALSTATEGAMALIPSELIGACS